MKRMVNIIFAIIAMLVLAGAASAASEYTVKKGDNLSKIGKQFQVSWKVLARESGIKNPHRIYPGQKIVIPDNFYWEHANADPFKGTLDEALVLNGYSAEVADALKKAVGQDHSEDITIKDGDYIESMTFGKNKVKTKVIARTGKDQPAKLYKAEVGGVVYQLIYPQVCGNWSRLKEIPKPEEPPVEPPTVTGVPEPAPEEKGPKPKIPTILQPHRIPKKIIAFKYEPIKCIDFELNARQGFWWGRHADGEFSYAEGGIWDTCWYWGRMAGFYATRDSGETDEGYKWKSGIDGIINPGVQVGLRYLDFYKKDDGTVLVHGWTAKLRLMYAKITGKNEESLYHMTQRDLMLGIYLEYVRFLSKNTVGAVTFEAWFSLWSDQESSWAGDSPSNRGWLQVSAYIQKYIDDEFAVRFGGYGFHHLWDHEFGIGAYIEGRYDDWLLAGINASFGFENGLSWGPYVGAEFGNAFRKERDRKNISKIIAVNEDGNPIEKGGDENYSAPTVIKVEELKTDAVPSNTEEKTSAEIQETRKGEELFFTPEI